MYYDDRSKLGQPFEEKEQEDFKKKYGITQDIGYYRQGALNAQQVNSQQEPNLKDTGIEIGKGVGKELATQGIKNAFATSGGSSAATGSTLASTPAQNAAWNAGATKAGGGLAKAGMGATLGGAAGVAVAGVNAVDAISNITKDSRRGKGAVEGTTTLIGTTLGAIFGGGIGAGIGSVAGRFVGRGLASLGDSAGWIGQKSHLQHAQEIYGEAEKAALTDIDKEGVNHFYQQTVKQIEEGEAGSYYKDGPLTDRQWKWQDVKNVSTGTDVWGEYGFFQAFPDWISGYTEEQRKEIASAALDHDLLTHDPKKGRLFSAKEGDLDAIQEIALQIKEGSYVPLYSDEERYQNKQEYLQQLADTEGYISPELGKPYEPPIKQRGGDETDDDDVVQETGTVDAPRGEKTRRPLKKRPPKFNEVPDVQKQEPTIKSPTDYAQAYLSVYNKNSGRY